MEEAAISDPPFLISIVAKFHEKRDDNIERDRPDLMLSHGLAERKIQG